MATLDGRRDMTDLTDARVKEANARTALVTVVVIAFFLSAPALIALAWKAAL